MHFITSAGILGLILQMYCLPVFKYAVAVQLDSYSAPHCTEFASSLRVLFIYILSTTKRRVNADCGHLELKHFAGTIGFHLKCIK